MQSIILTGGNSGLGFEAAKSIATQFKDFHLVLACRNPASAEEAVASLKTLSGHEYIEALPLDLASQESVRAFVQMFLSRKLPPLYALVCNAGLQVTDGTRRTSEGYELTFGVNHLGHFLLTHLLLPHISPKGRVVVVSSGTHYNPPIWQSSLFGIPAPQYIGAEALADPANFAGMNEKKKGYLRYSTSKLCNLMFAYELDRRLRAEKSQITVNAYDPGLMPGTGLARTASAFEQWAWRNIMPVMTLFDGVFTVAESGRNLANLAVSAEKEGVTGKYYEGAKEKPSSAESHDQAKWADLWAVSERLTGSQVR